MRHGCLPQSYTIIISDTSIITILLPRPPHTHILNKKTQTMRTKGPKVTAKTDTTMAANNMNLHELLLLSSTSPLSTIERCYYYFNFFHLFLLLLILIIFFIIYLLLLLILYYAVRECTFIVIFKKVK